MKNIILDILKQALCGRKLWKKIISKNKVDLKYDFVVLVSKDDGVYDLKIGKINRKTRPRIPKKIYKDPDFYNYVCQNDLRINDE